VVAGYYDDKYIYVHNVVSTDTRLAVSMDEGFSPFGSAWRFPINENARTKFSKGFWWCLMAYAFDNVFKK